MLKITINSTDVFKILSCDMLHEKVFPIGAIGVYGEFLDNALYFFNKLPSEDEILQFKDIKNSIFVVRDVTEDLCFGTDNVVVHHDNPRFAMACVLEFIEKNNLYYQQCSGKRISNSANIHSSCVVESNVLIGENVIIEPLAYIGNNVIIGDNSVIKMGAKIVRNVVIGKHSIIRENAVIGGYGFGIEKDQNANNHRIPHLGGVQIGDYVEVGALSTVCSGTLSPTCVENYVKLDDHVHIAHNVIVGENSIITAGAILSGSVKCGERIWIGPNATIIQKKRIEKDSLVGIGAVVIGSVRQGRTVFGNPAIKIS